MRYCFAVKFAFMVTVIVSQPLAARADDEAEAKRTALDLTKKAAVEYLKDHEFKFDSDQVQGTAKAVEPEDRVKVEITDFLFVPGRVTATFRIDARFAFDGTLKVKDEKTAVKSTADIRQDIDVVADYRFENYRLKIDSRVKDARFKVNVLKLEPDDLPGGKKFVNEVVEKQLERQKGDILRELNAWLVEQNR